MDEAEDSYTKEQLFPSFVTFSTKQPDLPRHMSLEAKQLKYGSENPEKKLCQEGPSKKGYTKLKRNAETESLSTQSSSFIALITDISFFLPLRCIYCPKIQVKRIIQSFKYTPSFCNIIQMEVYTSLDVLKKKRFTLSHF